MTYSNKGIHPSAIIHPMAKIADNVKVGPFSVIDENVEIGEGTVVGPHVVINGHTTIGKNNHFYQFSSIGEANQDKKYKFFGLKIKGRLLNLIALERIFLYFETMCEETEKINTSGKI